MVPISTGSTLMVRPSSHAITFLMSSRLPSISSEMMPISGVTLAWPMLVTIGYLWPISQMIGRRTSFCGIVSQNRRFSFLTGLILDVFLGRVAMESASSDRGDDRHFVAILQRRLFVLQKADIL